MYSDFKELLSALNAHRVRYLVVGGYAVSFHAEPREGAWQRRVDVPVDDKLTASFISRDDLLAAKISAGRAARGWENWLELRRKKIEISAAPASERSREESEFTRDTDKGTDDDGES